MTPEKQILYNLMADTAVAYWEKSAGLGLGWKNLDVRKPSWNKGINGITKTNFHPRWYDNMLQDQQKAQKAQSKQAKELAEKDKLPKRNGIAEMYAFNHGADFRLLYSDPARAAEMVLMDYLQPKSHALLPNPMNTAFTPEYRNS